MAATGDIDVTGGDAGTGRTSGGITVEATGPVALASGALFDLHGRANGSGGGQIRIRSSKSVVVDSATIDARGNSNNGTQGSGGTVEIAACTVDLKGTALLDVRGYRGGSVAVFGQHTQPVAGVQPVTIRSSAVLRATGTDPARNGALVLRANSLAEGICSNSGAACWIDTDCTVGCQTGVCNNANPDTKGTLTQFDSGITRAHLRGIGASCGAVCP